MGKPIKKQVWNNVDAIGLINGISTWDDDFLNLKYVRIPGESNIDLRNKINKFSDDQNPITGNIDQQLIIGLANELGLDSYSITNKTTFDLSRFPMPIGDVNVQDINVYYQLPNTDTWVEITPQLWGSDVKDVTPTTGFIVWEDVYYSESLTTTKTNNYSRLLQIYDDLPDQTRIKAVYNIQQVDEDNNRITLQFTDMSNPNNTLDTRFIYRKGYDITPSGLATMPVVYDLSNIPTNFSGYYNSNGTATDLLYRVKDKIDSVYRHRWDEVSDRKTIWDINLNFSEGTIPSFYDMPFETPSAASTNIENNLTGGVSYYNTSLYIKDIDVVKVSGEIDKWYPVMQPGPFYVDGSKYYLMENASGEYISFSGGMTTLPSGIEIYHKVILDTSTSVPNIGYIYDDADYELNFVDNELVISGTYILNDGIARKRAYLTSNMGYDLTLASGEYMIDYASGVIYSSGIVEGVLYWDDVIVPENVIIESTTFDLNPLNDTSLGYDDYFLTIG